MAKAPTTLKIGLLGTTSAGKTTFIASLGRAPLRYSAGWGLGTATSGSPASSAQPPNTGDTQAPQAGDAQQDLGTWQHELNTLKFPSPTNRTGALYTWQFEKTTQPAPPPPPQPKRTGFFGGQRETPPVTPVPPVTELFQIQVRDAAGELLSLKNGGDDQKLVAAEIATLDGLILLFDPAISGQEETASQHETFLFGAQALGQSGSKKFIAACVMKIDDSRVYFDHRTTESGVMRDINSQKWPNYPNPPASMETYFKSWAPDLHTGINNYFNPERVAYFAVSSIGFRSSKSGGQYWDGIDWNDVQNSRAVDRPGGGGQQGEYQSEASAPATLPGFVINTNPTPINVLEPFLWMYRQKTAAGT